MAPTHTWQWHTVADAAGLEDAPPRCSPQPAQAWCNFTLWHPAELPGRCDTAVGTLRKEAPPGRTAASAGRTPWSDANPAAYRTEISGGGRRLRLKQFLYDWAFPAADHPCLWGSETRAFPIGAGRVVWLGTDYLGHSAASARMSRTTVELSVLEGEFADEELVDLYRALRPADPAAPARIVRTAFSELSYWARHTTDMVSVPTGLYFFHRRDRLHEGDWVPTAELASFLAAQDLPAGLSGFASDSAVVFTGPQGARELEAIYTNAAGGGELRLVLQRSGAGRMPYPPEREKHPARTQKTQVRGRSVDLAYVDPAVGPFDAVWQDPALGVEGKLLSSAGQGMDVEFVLGCLDTLLTCSPLAGRGAAL
ncbi:hypothetical protein FBY35_0666 [Streptomyces sp. SLBN-118]|uniref:hypothetical protein n=1 Tax=Streptomyces sp. SLBN-118 TaxID=2768454 RepID=UPI001151FD20|nr:hypothetical protein [Streptomyces sp. SLBN-118]TQK50340.1 hypothetical protein FBY35_0666 [Streptomyces sp. SLBN-118]